MAKLVDHYHVVLFDNIGWGLNTRLLEANEIDGADNMEHWIASQVDQTIDGLSEYVPDKFFLAAHSFGGFIASQYASLRPERIEALLLYSAMTASYDPETYNPLKCNHIFECHRLYNQEEFDENKEWAAKNITFVDILRESPDRKNMIKGMAESLTESADERDTLTEEQR